MEKTVAEIKVVETEKGFRLEVEGEDAKDLLKRWRENQGCCSCC